MTTTLVFDIETIPDVEGLRKLHGLGKEVPDRDVADMAFQLRRQVTGNDFLQLHLQHVVVISCALRERDSFKVWSLGDAGEDAGSFTGRFLVLARNSFSLAALTAGLAALLALLLGFAARDGHKLPRLASRVVGLGYAVPGSVIAVGVLIPVTRLDHLLAGLWQQMTGANPGLILTGGIAALVYAYLARFLAIALQTVEAGLGRITPSMESAARSLGSGPGETLRRVHLPLMRGSLLTAALLVFVDVMKELPATLVMRPFNFDTLATQTYTLAADERLAEASGAALAIVAVGLLPIILLARQIAAGRSEVSSC